MPITKRKYTRKPMRRRRAAPRRGAARRGARVALPLRTTGNFASVTETFSVAVTAGVVNDFTFNVGDTVRAEALLSAFQYYRISSVEMRFKPQIDTFISGGPSLLPYLYFQYDKSGSLAGLNAQGFEDIGTKAIRLDDKTIVRKWKPSVITLSSPPLGGMSQFKTSPWLPTHQTGGALNNSVTHLGAIFYISKMSPGDATVYDVDVVINVQYRKPLVAPSSGAETVNPPRIKQGLTTEVDLSLNPHLVT